ncbi:hypothetical protein AB5N19_04163 [Seiridium cardinale]|uniref:Uncharacterized protein n=1 Tax=Seiridium cardinale TaxID=138064 RepID=A0ABR2Y9Q0_9PEZI
MSPRLFAMRSTLRGASRWIVPSQLARPVARRGYASQHSAAKSSDLPWLIGSVGVTLPGLAYLLSNGPQKADTGGSIDHHKSHTKGSSDDDSEQTPSKSKSDEGSEGGEPESSHKSAQAGQDVPPPPSDNSSLAENTEDKKKAHEEYKETMEKRDTKVATSSSDMPSKKTAGEHPREDPHKGEGEANQKGGPRDGGEAEQKDGSKDESKD